METIQKQYKLYLPVGTINTERILYILQFVRSNSIQIRMIQQSLTPTNTINEEGNEDSVRSASLEEISHKDTSEFVDRAYITSKLSEYEKLTDPISAFSPRDEEPITPTLSYSDEDIRLPPMKSKSLCHKDSMSKSVRNILDQPCLIVSQSIWLYDPNEIYQELKISQEFTLNLMPDEQVASIAATIKRIVHSVDTYVRKVLAIVDRFPSHENDDHMSLLKVKSKTRIGKFTNYMKLLYECLDYFEKDLLPAGQFLNGSSFSLSDLYLFVSLRRPFQLLFDKKIRKFWLPNLTAWFKTCLKAKEAQSVFGEFKLCKVSYLQLIEQIQEPPRSQSQASKIEEETPASIRTKLEQFVKMRSGNIVLDRSFEGYFEDLKLGDIPDKDYSLWSFKYLTANEEPFQAEYFSRKLNCVDEVEEFSSNLIRDLEKENKAESVTFLVIYSKCEEVKPVFSLGKQKLQECENHRGRFFLKKECAGFSISFSKAQPKVIKAYEHKDLIEVKPIEERKAFLRRMLLLRDDDDEMEKVYLQQVI
jgi:hypothetical protein